MRKETEAEYHSLTRARGKCHFGWKTHVTRPKALRLRT
jgi:hypothetical protein